MKLFPIESLDCLSHKEEKATGHMRTFSFLTQAKHQVCQAVDNSLKEAHLLHTPNPPPSLFDKIKRNADEKGRLNMVRVSHH